MAIRELIEPIYQRQDGESDQAWRLFQMYRDTPMERKRRYADVAEASGTSLDLVEKYGASFRWRDRVLAYDRELDAKAIEQITRLKVNMAERHSTIAMMMLHKVGQAITRIEPEKLTPRDVKEWVDVATRVEALARGEATSITRTFISTEEQDRQTKEQLVKEAKEFFNEMRIEQPELPLESLLQIVVDEFQVIPEELGVTVPKNTLLRLPQQIEKRNG